MPVRTCVGCRQTDAQCNLVRIVLDATGRVQVDRKRRLSGRGAWLHESRACVEKAVHNSGLPRAFRRKIQPLDGERLLAIVTNGT
jgi:predicted RNA-binding protein YlxR (DUF448 family)